MRRCLSEGEKADADDIKEKAQAYAHTEHGTAVRCLTAAPVHKPGSAKVKGTLEYVMLEERYLAYGLPCAASVMCGIGRPRTLFVASS
jgi:hypothetical protein